MDTSITPGTDWEASLCQAIDQALACIAAAADAALTAYDADWGEAEIQNAVKRITRIATELDRGIHTPLDAAALILEANDDILNVFLTLADLPAHGAI